jgi:hypothetical protein
LLKTAGRKLQEVLQITETKRAGLLKLQKKLVVPLKTIGKKPK